MSFTVRCQLVILVSSHILLSEDHFWVFDRLPQERSTLRNAPISWPNLQRTCSRSQPWSINKQRGALYFQWILNSFRKNFFVTKTSSIPSRRSVMPLAKGSRKESTVERRRRKRKQEGERDFSISPFPPFFIFSSFRLFIDKNDFRLQWGGS